jgi:carbohydrate-selective porin OprB
VYENVVWSQEEERISDLLKEETQIKRGLVAKWGEDRIIYKILQPYLDAKQWLHDELRMDLAMQHVVIYQRATGGRNPYEHAVSNFNLFGNWYLMDTSTFGKGFIGYSFERRDNLTDATGTEFSREVGTSYNTHDLPISKRDRTALRQLWWEHRLANETVIIALGKLNPKAYYNRNTFSGSTNTQFISQPFSTNPARLFPSNGLGINVTISPGNNSYFTLGFQDANAKNTTSGFQSIDKRDFFKACELALFCTFDGLGLGHYRFTLWHTDEVDDHDDGSGFALSFDQEMGKKLGLFLRYGYSEPELGRIEHLLAVGLVIRNPLGIQGDLFGIGFAWDRANSSIRDEYTVEAFYRIQLTSHLQVTPDILFIVDPSEKEEAGTLAVFGIRFRVLF